MAGGYGSIAFMEREVLSHLLFPNTSGKSIVMTKEKEGWEMLGYCPGTKFVNHAFAGGSLHKRRGCGVE